MAGSAAPAGVASMVAAEIRRHMDVTRMVNSLSLKNIAKTGRCPSGRECQCDGRTGPGGPHVSGRIGLKSFMVWPSKPGDFQ